MVEISQPIILFLCWCMQLLSSLCLSMLLVSITHRLKSRKMISGLIMLQDCGIVHIGISSGYIVWQIEMCHRAHTLEGMASQWVLFHVVTNVFFIFILVLLCMPVQMTAQKISDKIKDRRTWSPQNRPKLQQCLLSRWFEDSHTVAHIIHSSLTCESMWLTTSNYLKIPSKFSCLLAGVHVLAIGMWEGKTSLIPSIFYCWALSMNPSPN